jgi:uncharacterized protein DUF3105
MRPRRGPSIFRLGLVASIGSVLSASVVFAGGCGTSASPGGGGGGDAGTDGPITTTVYPNDPPLPGETECKVVETTGIPIASRIHVPICTPVDYPTNPPCGGNHWPVWAAYREYTTQVPREMYVHDLEHGAVVLLYRCQEPCPNVVSALHAQMNDIDDPLCLTAGEGVNARLVLTPDPLLATPIAATAWGATYVATCIDPPSLKAFILSAYGKGPEVLCNDGFDPAAYPCDGGADGD